MLNKQLANLTDIIMLVESAVKDSKCEIWLEQDAEDYLLVVFSLSSLGRRVTQRYTQTDFWSYAAELEPRVFKELMDAWNEAPMIVMA